ncbi:MAG: PQQ-dependent sugar dehydrogenase [Planctomycetales bacterium]|nr:PQQ-dependent sugar dehydrogenase [Planctomycetales bacterium]
MEAVDLCVFLTSYTLLASCFAFADLLRSRRVASLVAVAASLIAVVATTVVGFYLKPGENYIHVLRQLVLQRDFSAVVSVMLGVAVALAWGVRLIDHSERTGESSRYQTFRLSIVQLVFVASLCGVVLCSQAFIWKQIRGIKRDPVARMNVPGFTIQKVAHLDFRPIRVAADESGKVYVCYDYFESAGGIGGAIVELATEVTSGVTSDEAPDTDSFNDHTRIVASSPMLMRCYGLVARNGELIVSRSGIWPRADQGKITYESTGAITQLRDIDGDGYFEYANDIVTGLPGSRGPETMHQNNGIVFGDDGSLFIASASAGNRLLDDHPWGGTVLRVSPDYSVTEVYAKGFRNPFGLAFGPDHELFITDNDADENPGDELNHVIQGEHYGHPYVIPNESSVVSEGFRDPILVGEHEWNFLGLTFATSESLPESCRNCFYVADFMQHAIWRVKLSRSGDTYEVTSVDKFASVSSPIDIVSTPSGDMYLISRNTQNVYRIRPDLAGGGASNE